ncbi:unnamed protein product, partial [Porites evermanni]
FHNNAVTLNRNLENLQNQLLHEVDFHFNVIGVTETKITNANSQMCTAHIPGYVFEYVPTPLASGFNVDLPNEDWNAPMKTISNRKAKQLSKPWITE